MDETRYKVMRGKSKKELINIIERQERLINMSYELGPEAIQNINIVWMMKSTIRMFQIAFEFLLDETDDETLKTMVLFTLSLDPDYKLRNGRYLSIVELYKQKPEYVTFVENLYSKISEIDEGEVV